MSFANTLKELRKARKLTKQQLADATGLSVYSIISYENGRREPNAKALTALEQYFGVTGAYLHGESTLENLSDGSTDDRIDTIAALYETCLMAYKGSADEERRTSFLEFLEAAFGYLSLQMRHTNPGLYSLPEGAQIIFSLQQLTRAGAEEMAKRMNEYRIMEEALEHLPD